MNGLSSRVRTNPHCLDATASAQGMPNKVCGDPRLGKVKPVAEWGDLGAWIESCNIHGVIPFAASGVHRRGNPEGMTGKRSPSKAPSAGQSKARMFSTNIKRGTPARTRSPLSTRAAGRAVI